VTPATLAHQAMLWGLRDLQEVYGAVDALPTLDDLSHQAWYAEEPFLHLAG
jgi:hypothetical protein